MSDTPGTKADYAITRDQLAHLRRVVAGEEIPLVSDVRLLLTAYEAAIGREGEIAEDMRQLIIELQADCDRLKVENAYAVAQNIIQLKETEELRAKLAAFEGEN